MREKIWEKLAELLQLELSDATKPNEAKFLPILVLTFREDAWDQPPGSTPSYLDTYESNNEITIPDDNDRHLLTRWCHEGKFVIDIMRGYKRTRNIRIKMTMKFLLDSHLKFFVDSFSPSLEDINIEIEAFRQLIAKKTKEGD